MRNPGKCTRYVNVNVKCYEKEMRGFMGPLNIIIRHGKHVFLVAFLISPFPQGFPSVHSRPLGTPRLCYLSFFQLAITDKALRGLNLI